MKDNEIAVFETKNIRRSYDVESEIWYFSLVDIVAALTESVNPTDYLKKIRKRDTELNSYIGTNCPHVVMKTNGKNRKTLAGNAEHIFRLIQSIPSPKAEPFKQWLAKVGYERLQEIQDPSLSMDRVNARKNYSERKLRFLAPLEMTLTRQCGGGGKGGEAAFPSPLMTAKAVISSASEKSLFERNQSFTALALF